MAGKASVPCNAVVTGYLLKYSCEYPVTTALQGTLALPAIPWLKVAGATYSKLATVTQVPQNVLQLPEYTGPLRALWALWAL